MLNKPSEPPLSDGCSIAFGICTTAPNQNHIALIYRNADSQLMLLHHAWHNNTVHEPWNGGYFTCGFSHLDVELQETFADWAANVSARLPHTKTPYGVFYRLKDTDGQTINEPDDLAGLSCATYLLELFEGFDLPLLQIASWPMSRPGDYAWLRKIMKWMRGTVPRSQWMAHFRYRHKLRRYRPEEIAGAAFHFSGSPLHFDVVSPAGEFVLAAMREAT